MPTKPLRVLIVDDCRDTCWVLGKFLELLGHNASLTTDAGTALSRARNSTFDLLLLDVYLPGLNGWELLGELDQQKTRPAHAISMSSFINNGEPERSKAVGCLAHLIKPFNLHELEAVLPSIYP